jgi:tetratricopeptide (TPR) repeat protein
MVLILAASIAAIIGAGAAALGFIDFFDLGGTASAAFRRREYGTALRNAEGHLAWFPRSQSAALLAARSLTRLGRHADAELYYERCRSIALDDLHARAMGLIQADKPQQAAAVYDQILRRSPNDPLALKRSSAVLMGLKQWDRLLEPSSRLIAIPGEPEAGWTLAAIAHHERKQYAQAVEAATKVLELDPELRRSTLPRSLFLNNFALDLLALGRADEARERLTRALAIGEDAGLRELLGTAYSQLGDMEQAEHAWRKAAETDPGNADAWLGLGRLAMSRQRWQEAVLYLGHAAELSRDAVDPLYNLSLAHQRLGHTQEADRYKRLADSKRRSAHPSGGMGTMPDTAAVSGFDLSRAAEPREGAPE